MSSAANMIGALKVKFEQAYLTFDDGYESIG